LMGFAFDWLKFSLFGEKTIHLKNWQHMRNRNISWQKKHFFLYFFVCDIFHVHFMQE
jgi:hypothetical protein